MILPTKVKPRYYVLCTNWDLPAIEVTMRKCVCCDELTDHDDPTCCHCFYVDAGWKETLISRNPGTHITRISIPHNEYYTTSPAKTELEHTQYCLNLSSFGDTIEFGFHLSRIQAIHESSPTTQIEVTIDTSSLAYDWDYSYDFDNERDVFLPPSVPLLSLVEAARLSQILLGIKNVTLKLILPPQDHAVASFLLQSELFSMVQPEAISFSQDRHDPVHSPGCDDVLVPLTYIGASTSGQLSSRFHSYFNSLLDAGLIKEIFRPLIRNVIMEAAENADSWGGHGWIACFLRQEKRGKANWGHEEGGLFDPKRETHLFLHVFSTGPSLAQSVGCESEWDAADRVTAGFSARSLYGGNGIPNILRAITQNSVGTVFMISGPYTRIVSPDGLIREFMTSGSEYLPGLHLGAVIPLAVISELGNEQIEIAGA